MSRYAVGVDLGGTKIAAGLVSESGKIADQVTELTRAEEGVAPVVARIAACIQRLLESAGGEVAGIGIGTAGMTDSREGVVIMASNLQWKQVPVRRLIGERLGEGWVQRIWVDKDTNAAVLGEMLYGAGRGSAHLLYVTVGTGVGGGMVLGGSLYHGASEGASDIGHLVLEPEGRLCGCGKRGCLETLASGPAIARQAREALQAADQESGLRNYDPGDISAREVVEAAQQGDRLAQSVLAKAGYWLGLALAYYTDINNPERIIIGGGVAAAGDLLLNPVRETVARFALPNNTQTLRIVPAGLQSDSGVIGAAALVWPHHRQ